MKKRLLTLALVATMIFTMLAVSGCADKEEPETITSDITLVQGINPSYPPFASVDEDGNPAGFDVELCQALCAELGWNYEFKTLSGESAEAESALLAGDCDCLWSAFVKEGEEENYEFSVPYGTASQVIVVKKDSGIKTLDDLAGRMVAVQDQTVAFTNLNSGTAADLANSFGALIVELSAEICFQDLEKGAVDAIIVEDTIADYLIGDKTADYEYMSENLGWDTYVVAFRPEDGELAAKVSEGLKTLQANGKFDEIAAKYPAIKPYLSVGSE